MVLSLLTGGGFEEVAGDGVIGVEANPCILQVDDDFYEDLDAERTKALIEALRRGERPAPGSTTGRQTSAPEGGPTTLTTLEFPANAVATGD